MSLTELEYVKQERALGRRLHFHDGIWWRQRAPLYFKPAYRFKKISPGSARPALLKGGLTYSHLVPDGATANRTLTYYAMTRATLSRYDLEMLSASKRKAVRRGCSRCEIRLLSSGDLDLHKEDIKEIVISQAIRQRRDIFGLPPSYYEVHFEDWWRAEVRVYRLPGRDVWGAFVSGKLVGYMFLEQVEGVANFVTSKFNTDYSSFRPMDGLYYRIICAARDDPSCQMVLSGGPSKASLAEFKETFQFRLTDVPIYTRGAGLYRLATRLTDAVTATRQRFATRRASVPDVGPTPPDAPE